MTGARTHGEWEVRLAPQGIGRFFSAAFLAFWLCFWAVGESFALWILIKGGHALLTGTPPDPGRAPLEIGPSLAFGGFLILWLTFWTAGGIAAFWALISSLSAEDRILVRDDGLEVRTRRGPFHRTRIYTRDRLRAVSVGAPKSALVLETDRDRVVLSDLGTVAERFEAASVIRSQLRPEEGSRAEIGLPRGWEEIITPEGERAVIQSRATRKIQAAIAGVAAAVLSIVALAVVTKAMTQPGLIPAVLLSLAATGALAWGAGWLAYCRTEYRIGSGSVTVRRRFRSSVRDVMEARRLELSMRSDSDGDEWFELEALSSEVAAPTLARYGQKARKRRRTIVSIIHDPTVPQRLGAWMAQAANVPLTDGTTREAREAEVQALTEQLTQSGPFGRFAAGLIRKGQETRDKNA